MIIHPFAFHNFDHMINVWKDWQSFNVGILAFATSLILLNIALLQEKTRLERELNAVRAFLPQSLDELSDYLEESADLYKTYLMVLVKAKKNGQMVQDLLIEDFKLPVITNGYRATFRDCMLHANADVVKYLTYILTSIQIHSARMKGVHETLIGKQMTIYTNDSVIDLIVRLGELKVLVNNLFDYARGEDSFHLKDMNINSFVTAYRTLKFHQHIDQIEKVTRRRLENATDHWRLGWKK